MDRQIVKAGQTPLEIDVLATGQFGMVGNAKTNEAILGTATCVSGFSLAPTAPASLSAVLSPGTIFQQANLEATAVSSLPADTTHTIVKQGIALDPTTLTFVAPTTVGYAVNVLVQAQYQDVDTGAVVRPYYNAANPTVQFNGPGGAGASDNTIRKGAVSITLNAGIAATSGTQTTPGPAAGTVGLFVVTLAQGQTTITSGNIVQYGSAPFIPATLPAVPAGVQSGAWTFGIASGTNTYAATLFSTTANPFALTQGMEILVYFGNANTTTTPTLNVNGTGAKSVLREAGGAPFVGDIAGYVPLIYTGTAWIIDGLSPGDIGLLAPKLASVNPTIHVNVSTGNDAYDGSTTSLAVATIARAYVLASAYFIPGGQVTIKLDVTGTYVATSPPAGLATPVVILGDTANQDSYIISGAGVSTAVFLHQSGNVSYQGVRLNNSANTNNLLAAAYGGSASLSYVTLAATGTTNALAATTSLPGGSITFGPGCKVVSNFGSLISAINNGVVTVQQGATITAVGGPTFSTATVVASNGGRVAMAGSTFSGTANGARYSSTNGGGIDTGGGGANFIFGSSAGSAPTGYYT